MVQKTLVVALPSDQHAALEARLGAGRFEHRRVPYARFSVKGEGVVATLYRSGKLVVQGESPEAFLARYTDVAPPAPCARKPLEDPFGDADEPVVASDEAGKGDYFGPLVVAAVRLEPGLATRLREQGVADSKVLSDARALQLGALLRASLPHAIERLDPADYNDLYQRSPGLNAVLAGLHARAIGRLAKPGMRVLVDQFAADRVMLDALAGRELRLAQAPRGERNVAVAAASVLARQEFLVALRELSEEHGVALHKGAGSPVDRVGREFVRTHGAAGLRRVAKLHFKNTQRVLPRSG